MTVQEKLYTVEEFWEIAHLTENSEKRLELVAGVINEMPPAGGEHGEIGANLLITVGTQVRERHLGHITTAETGYILFTSDEGRETVRAPDVGYVSYQRFPDHFPPTYIPLPPDLAIEIVSPNDKAWDIEGKVNDYLRAGIRMFVFVYPATKSVSVYRDGKITRLSADDTLDFGDLLPGFSLPVREIF